MATWVLYGATGYTGILLSEEAARRGHRPILAGRNPEKLRALGERLGLEWKAVPLSDGLALRALVEGAGAVLHAAGPFVDTSRPMADACLEMGCSYLDITGELPVFEALFARDAEAKAKQVALIPGVGFDVVPFPAALRNLAAFRGFLGAHPERFLLVERAADIGRAKREGKLGVAFDIEGMEVLGGQVEMIEVILPVFSINCSTELQTLSNNQLRKIQ